MYDGLVGVLWGYDRCVTLGPSLDRAKVGIRALDFKVS